MSSSRRKMTRHKRIKGPFGLYDTQDKVWLGTETEVYSYTDHDLALAGHTLHCVSLGLSGKRVKVLPLPPSMLTKRDSIPRKILFDQPGELIRRYKRGTLV